MREAVCEATPHSVHPAASGHQYASLGQNHPDEAPMEPGRKHLVDNEQRTLLKCWKSLLAQPPPPPKEAFPTLFFDLQSKKNLQLRRN
eukprot:248043-Amphidinium_carterae.1